VCDLETSRMGAPYIYIYIYIYDISRLRFKGNSTRTFLGQIKRYIVSQVTSVGLRSQFAGGSLRATRSNVFSMGSVL